MLTLGGLLCLDALRMALSDTRDLWDFPSQGQYSSGLTPLKDRITGFDDLSVGLFKTKK